MESPDKIFPILSVLWKEELEEPLGRKSVFLQPRGLGMSPDEMGQDLDMEDAQLLLQSVRLKEQKLQRVLQPAHGEEHLCSAFKLRCKLRACAPEKGNPGVWGRA